LRRQEFARFLVTGGIAAMINIGSRYLLNMSMRFEFTVIVAYLAGLASAYVLARNRGTTGVATQTGERPNSVPTPANGKAGTRTERRTP
jgi:hypothetical protein